jgi:acyl-CoA thioesterase I
VNRNLLIGICSAVLLVGAFFYFKKSEIKVAPPKNSIIVAFGDSLVQGVGATEGNDFVSLVSKQIGQPITNYGKSGDTTASALERINTVLADDPGIVVLLLGGNDYLRRVPKETTFANLHTIISKFKENNTRVLLLGVRGGLLKDTYEEDFEKFAKEEKVPFVPNVLSGLIGNKEYMSDEIHPNDSGYKKMADRVAPVLKEIISSK